jgi:hypothetical protein
MKETKIVWHKVPGHVGILGNERADTIASTMAEKGEFELYTGPVKDYSFDLSDTSYDDSKKQERSDKRQRQNKKAYSYISLVDGVVETHQTWTECEKRVKGQKKARFKKSLDAGDEQAIIADFTNL